MTSLSGDGTMENIVIPTAHLTGSPFDPCENTLFGETSNYIRALLLNFDAEIIILDALFSVTN